MEGVVEDADVILYIGVSPVRPVGSEHLPGLSQIVPVGGEAVDIPSSKLNTHG
jgi:hypothetical protein